MVKGGDSKVYAIKIFTKEQCSCTSVGTCYHIFAAKLSIGLEITSVKVSGPFVETSGVFQCIKNIINAEM